MSIATPEKILDLAVTYSGGRYHLEDLFSSFPKSDNFSVSYSLLINTTNQEEIAYAKQASKILPDINLIFAKQKNSPLRSRSILSKQSRAHYIWFIDDDDELLTNGYLKIQKDLESKCFDWLQIGMLLDSGKKIISKQGIFNNQETKKIYCDNYIYDDLFITPHMANKIYRKDLANNTFEQLVNLEIYLLEDDYFNSCFIQFNPEAILKIYEASCYKYFYTRSIPSRKRNYSDLHYNSVLFVLNEVLRMDIVNQSGRNIAGFLVKLKSHNFGDTFRLCAYSKSQKITYLKIISCMFNPLLITKLAWRKDFLLFSSIMRREIFRLLQIKPSYNKDNCE